MKVLIDSRFRESGSLTEYKYILPHPIKKVSEIRLLQTVLPNSIYSVDSSWNTFSFTEDPTGTPDQQTITIPVGNYTGTQLAQEIQTQLRADMTASDYVVSYNTQTNKLTTSSASVAWRYDTGMGEEMAGILGLNTTGSGTVSSGTDYEHTKQVDLSYPRYLYLDINTGASNTNDVMTNDDAHSFMVNLGKDPYELEKTTSLVDYFQVENNNNNDVRHLDIKILLPSRNDRSPEFNGIDHQFLLELL